MATKKKETPTSKSGIQEAVRSRVSQTGRRVGEKVNASAEETRKVIRKQPLTAVGAAAGVALAVGVVGGAVLASKVMKSEKEDADPDLDAEVASDD